MLSAPRPTRLLVFNSVVVIGGCIFTFSASLASVIAWPDPCSVTNALIVMLPSFWIGAAHYRAVFRRNSTAAGNAAIWLFLVCGLILIGISFAILAWSADIHAWNISLFLLLGAYALLGVYLFFCGRQQRRWAKQLRDWDGAVALLRDPADAPPTPGPFQYSLRELLTLVTVVAVITSLVTWFLGSRPPSFIEHATARQARLSLPEGASDVCCTREKGGTIVCEFTIGEKEFLDWAKPRIAALGEDAAAINLTPIENGISFSRYSNFHRTDPLAKDDVVTVTNGYEFIRTEGGQCVIFVYDKDELRAYHLSSPNIID